MIKFFAGSALAVLFTLPIQAFAAPILADVIYGFSWNGDGVNDSTIGAGFNGGVFDATNPGQSPWTFSGAGTFGVLDLEQLVDQFRVFDNGVLLGTTSAPGGGSCGLDIQACFFDPNASSASFAVGDGDHSITISANGSDRGRGVFQFTPPAPVPLPAAAWLFGSALLGLTAVKRRKA